MKAAIILLLFCAFSGVQMAALPFGCENGVGLVYCFMDPCQVAPKCGLRTDLHCVANYCGGCHAYWYDSTNTRVDCTATA